MALYSVLGSKVLSRKIKDLWEFIDNLNDLSVPTRYPDELDKLLKDYKKEDTFEVLEKTKKLLLCLKKML
jgi:HEPN domain-containing protein